jgi:dienelactone hydrolase
MITADKPVALADTEIALELRGFAPRQPAVVTATQTFVSESRWRAQATFMSDSEGRVSVAHQAPVSGSYSGISAMGLVWSAERVSGARRAIPDDWALRSTTIQIEATGSDGMRAELTLERLLAAPDVTRQAIRTDGLVGTLFLPAGDGPHPAVLLVHGGGGGIDEYRGAMLASHGYAAFVLAYFGAPGLPRNLVNIALEYFGKAIGWMRAQPWLGDGFLAVWGESRGGELALLLGATFPEIHAVSAWVPSGVMFWPIGDAEPGDTRPPASWTWRGEPLPYLQENNACVDAGEPPDTGEPIAYAPIYLRHLEDSAAVERATIPVEKIRGPVLLVSGNDDQMWPSTPLAEIAMRRLEAHRHPHAFTHLEYRDAGHMILVPYGPRTVRAVSFQIDAMSTRLYNMGGTPRADAEAGVDAWRKHLAFLDAAAGARR